MRDKGLSGEVFDAVIVGAGVTGLSASLRLQQNMPGAAVAITEAGDQVGGYISTRMSKGRLWEEGPNNFQPDDLLLSTACDVGLQDDILLADPKAYRFVWWEGRLRALPAGVADAVFGDFLSLRGKMRAGLGALGFWKKPRPGREESIREFVSRNLGVEAFERLVDPFISGVYAGDPALLSAEATMGRLQAMEERGGSLVAGARQFSRERKEENATKPSRDPRLPEVKGQTVGSFRGGLRQFADSLGNHVAAAGTPVRLRWKLRKLFWDAERKEHVLEYATPEGTSQLRSRNVVLTTPSHVAAKLLRPLSATAADALEEIRYPCVAVLTVEYPRSSFREPEHGKGAVNGFGQLHPRSQGIRTLGTIYNTSLFPEREPDPEKVMLNHYIGGSQDPTLFGGIDNMSEAELVEATHWDTVRTMLKPSAAAEMPSVLGVRIWPRAIPQLELGHAKRLLAAQDGLKAAGIQGLHLAGNYAGGVALRRCVEFGQEMADEVMEFLWAKPTGIVQAA